MWRWEVLRGTYTKAGDENSNLIILLRDLFLRRAHVCRLERNGWRRRPVLTEETSDSGTVLGFATVACRAVSLLCRELYRSLLQCRLVTSLPSPIELNRGYYLFQALEVEYERQ